MYLVSHNSYVHQLTSLSHAVTMTCDCYHTFCDSVMVMWYFPALHPSKKEKKRKEILNNNLAILPSHDSDENKISKVQDGQCSGSGIEF